MKKFDFKNLNFKFLKKYNYDINEVIGVKDNNRFILYLDKKLIRIYRGKLKSSALLCSYIPIESAIFYSFNIEKSVIEKIDLDSFVETRVYDEAGVDETEEYVIKYKVVDKLSDEKSVEIETVIVPVTYLSKNYQDILKESGYIDYLSFPAFSYKALYEEGILKKADDLFVVILHDKVFLTFYSEGELVYIQTLSGGIDRIYKALSALKIKDFDFELLKKILTKKGLSETKYSESELVVLEILKKEFANIISLINEQIDKYLTLYDVDTVERIFVTSEIGDILDLDIFFSRSLHIDAFNFEFYEKYNLDRLPVDPFLFLGMLETHYAYKKEDLAYNFSIFLRKPTFIYRPSGNLVIAILLSIILVGSYPFYLWVKGKSFENKNIALKHQIKSLEKEIAKLRKKVEKLNNVDKSLKAKIEKTRKKIKEYQTFIEDVYKFKYSYLPKSQELVDITKLMNKNFVYAKDIKYSNGIYTMDVFAYKEENIPNLIKSLSDNGFNVDFDQMVYKNNKYNCEIRIKE